MRKVFAAITSLLFVGCSGSELTWGAATLSQAIPSLSRDAVGAIDHRSSGLREQVDELFFQVTPDALKTALLRSEFTRDDSIRDIVRESNSSYKKLVGEFDSPSVIGFRRVDLTVQDGKYCHVVCAEDYSWAYLIFVDYGTS